MNVVDTPFDEPVRVPVGPELDLHTFSPRDLGVLLPAYLEACVASGYPEVRIVHGKGTGALRTSVHALLARSPLVVSYWQAGDMAGSWGATLVRLAVLSRDSGDECLQKKLRQEREAGVAAKGGAKNEK